VPGRPGQAVIAVTVPGDSISLLGDQKTQEYAGGAVIIASVVDAKGAVVRKLSQQYRLRGALGDAQTVRAKTLSFSRTPELPPGTYHVDAVVFDSAGDRASVVGRPLVIPEPHVPMVGDLMIVDHAERLPPDLADASTNPLVVNGLLLRPSADAKVHRGVQATANFALPLAVAPGAPAPPIVLALLAGDGAVLASVALPAAVPEASGRLLAVGRMPHDKIPVGAYQLQVTVGTGQDARVRKAALTVVE
jgi:hypothetical protein